MIHCKVCDSDGVEKIVDWKDYTIYKCTNCNLIFTNPLPDDQLLIDFYQGFLFNKPKKNTIQKEVRNRKKELKTLFNFQSLDTNTLYLDYGGGTGSSYKAASELGLNAYYHDLDEKAKAFVKETHGLDDDHIIDDIEKTATRFDYIFSDNVIEHVKDPVKFTTDLKDILHVGGQMVIKTPHGMNTEILFYPFISLKGYTFAALKYNHLPVVIKSYFKRFWHCDPPRHLYAFSKQNLELIAKKAGFRDDEIEVSYYRVPLFDFSLTKMFVSIKARHGIRSMFLRVIYLPIIPLELLSKLLQSVLISLNVLSAGGIILKLKKIE